MKRGMLIGAALLIAVAAAPVLWLVLDDGGERRTAALSTERTYTGAWSISINGVAAGPVQSVSGCEASGTIVNVSPTDKTIGQPRYTPCVLEVGLGMSAGFFNWIKSAMAGNAQPQDADLVRVDPATGAATTLRLRNAVVSGFATPSVNSSQTANTWLVVALRPELIQRMAGGSPTKGSSVPIASTNFSVSLSNTGGIKTARTVDSWSWGQEIVESNFGEVRDYQLQPATLTYGDFVVGIADSATGPAATLTQYFQSFVIQGNSGPAQEITGTLTLRDPTLARSLTLNLSGMGIFFADQAPGDAGRRFGFYVEGATFTVM